MEIVKALPIKGRSYRYRATIRWGERSAPVPLCSCKGGHISEHWSMECKHAKRKLIEIRRNIARQRN